MSNKKSLYLIINFLISLVWFVNGLYCKVFNFVPRHQQIVSTILGNQYAEVSTKLIGFSEIIMGVWIISGFQRKTNVFLQILVIITMNILENILAPNLLLHGKMNLIFAVLFSLFIGCNYFYVKPKDLT